MFVFEDPSDLDSDWHLGFGTANLGCIGKSLMRCVSNYHLFGIQFLFDNFIKKRKGAILNQHGDLNMPLQVCIFLNSVKEKIRSENPVLIICPDSSLCKWHYHMSQVDFKPHIISTENIDDQSEVYLMTFERMKLPDQLVNLDLSFIVIDELDAIATKRIVQKLKGHFNIGLTERNFYINPDQKLKWSMLNWASPGCVGKLNDFYSIDRLHSLAHADNYRFWWLRLTWKFCASFVPPSDEELQDYQNILQEWGKSNKINTSFAVKDSRLKRKCAKSDEKLETKKKRKYVRKKDKESKNIADPSASTSEVCSENDALEKDIKKYEQDTPQLNQEKRSNALHLPREDYNSVLRVKTDEPGNEPMEDFEYNSDILKSNRIMKSGVVYYSEDRKNEATTFVSENKTEAVLDRDDLEVFEGNSRRETDDIGIKIKEESENGIEENYLTKEKKSYERIESPETNDIISIFNGASKVKDEISESDDEDPILSILSSQKQPKTVQNNDNLLLDITKLSQSSESDSEFLSEIVKNKNKNSNSYRSQQISQVLDNLSDIEENTYGYSDDSDFFSDLILGKK